jgi:hypothetical protein
VSDLTTAFEITRNSNGNWVDGGVLKEGVHARICHRAGEILRVDVFKR